MNPYDVLGVTPEAADDDIARAYKRLAKRYHPDLNPDDADAARRMGEINRAYDEIKAMRQRGAGYEAFYGASYDSAYDPYQAAWRPDMRRRYYRRTVRVPMSLVLGVVVMFFFVRLILSLLFGGYSVPYYYYPPGGAGYPGFGYYDTITP